jgi:hypothetical protein
MATITSVMIGDERAQRDITSSFVKDHIRDGNVDVVSNSALIPMFETTPITKLSDQDDKEVDDNALKACGGNAGDQRCIESNKQTLRQARLAEKQREAQSTVNQIKGRRLTVSYQDEDGETRTVVVPDGQKFTLNGIKQDPKIAPADAQLPEVDLAGMLPAPSAIMLQIGGIVGTILMTFLYVFSIAATYKTLVSDYSRTLAIGGTTVAVFFPYSGYFIMLGYFVIREVFKYQTEDYTAKVLSVVIALVLAGIYVSSATFVGIALATKSAVSDYFFPPKKQ